ncbi:MAG: 16S rRNA (guanine(966)-N(2))-methyltransferase RsmD [Thermodesulfovibrionales bacterium]
MHARASARKPKDRGAAREGGKEPLRPTASKVKESLFNILMGEVEGSVFVDLYAGTGAVGAEAMSRKAEMVYFVEADRKRAERIEYLLSGCGCRARAVVVHAKAVDFLRRSASEGKSFDIVFIDPPYHTGEMDLVLPVVAEGGVLREGAAVVAEHFSKKAMPDEAGCLVKKKSYRYGDTTLTLYRRSD